MANNRLRELADEHGVKLIHFARRIGKAKNTLGWKLDTDNFTPEEKAMIVEEWNRIPRLTVAEMFPEAEQEAVEA